jgi:hypothetical protein
MIPEGALRKFIADGHDHASSMLSSRWRTPAGAVLVEGAGYLKEWRVKQRLSRIDRDGTKHYKLRGGWEVASEQFA